MKQHIACGMLAAGLATASPVSAGNWTMGVDVGPSQLEAGRRGDADTHESIGLRMSYWLTPSVAIEGSTVHAETSFETLGFHFDRNLNAFRLGVRTQWALGEKLFVIGRAGYDYSRIKNEDVEFAPIQLPQGPDIVRHRSDSGPYLGAGLGWRWSERWSSSFELTRMFGAAGFGCSVGGACETTHSSHFDTATLGIAYDFD